jgi:hypothetical protein
LLAGVVGLAWGIWVQWFPSLEGVQVSNLELTETLPFVIVGMILVALLPYGFRIAIVRMELEDWTLTPYEFAAAGGVLAIALLLRSESLSPLGLGIVLTLITMLVMMLFFTRTARQGSLLHPITPPRLPLALGWFLLIISFALMGALGYSLSTEGDPPFYARVLFSAITVFGALWVPVISIWLGTGLMIQYTREGL